MNILFVIDTLGYADHIAIACLSAVAKQKGHKSFFCLLSDCDLGKMVSEANPEVVAYSANVLSFENIVKNHKEVSRTRKFVSILGGPQATFYPESFQRSGVDAYCIGEGEGPFADFLDCVQKGKSFDHVSNLITSKACNPVRPLIADLDTLPVLDRDLVLSNSFLKNVPKKTFYATRGCPYTCNYCCNNYYHELYRNKGKFVRRFSVERVIQEIEYVREHYRTEFVKFGDDVFAMKADNWMREFAKKYRERIGLPFNCYLRFDTVTDELLSLLRDAGCYSVHLSVDSVSPYVRQFVLNRKMKNVNIAGLLRKIRSYGINTWVNYMLAAPESTTRNDIDTIFMSKRGRVTYAAYSMTVPMNGTKLYENALDKGYIDSDFIGDMTACSTFSPLKCFSQRDKSIRYNIYCLGAIVAKLPYFILFPLLFMIVTVPSNRFFRKIRDLYYKHSIENNIFKVED